MLISRALCKRRLRSDSTGDDGAVLLGELLGESRRAVDALSDSARECRSAAACETPDT